MTLSATEFFSNIENQYIIWSGSDEKSKEFAYQTEDVDVKIIFNRGRWIYPVANSPTPAVIENSINIASNNNDKIRNLFENSLLKEKKCFRFQNYKYDKFEVRFFLNESLIKNKLLDEEKTYALYESPRWGLEHECILI